MANIKAQRQETAPAPVKLSNIDLTNVFERASTNFQSNLQDLEKFLKDAPLIGDLIKAFQSGAGVEEIGNIFTKQISEAATQLGLSDVISPQASNAPAAQVNSPPPPSAKP
ncbi:MAG: hypothetical protein DI586_04435 [Micavibrio aeruginosavorus]|uniref:Uncharacterized protein n=1 Tax=Micavibrio aeruginosavorus TaxID=349221 RepID=A0A2W5FPB0_9BACT|nr:MAG: hypothetical protein DI586_04435 [Micavibrio aeruginosavorus]